MSLGGINVGRVTEFALVLLQALCDDFGLVGLGDEDTLVVDAQNRNLGVLLGQVG